MSPIIYKKQKGFTLIELLVVISIIGLLSSVVLGSLNSARAKSRDARRLQDLVQMRTALELYASSNDGKYPLNRLSTGAYYGQWVTSSNCFGNLQWNNPEGLSNVVMADGLVSGKYISKIPEDPKPAAGGKCYQYFGIPNDYDNPQYGIGYKFVVSRTAEFNTQSPKHTLRDLSGDSSVCGGTASLPNNLAIFSSGVIDSYGTKAECL